MKILLSLIGLALLFVLCWPLALIVLVAWPLVALMIWLIALPFRLLGAIVMLPARLLGWRGHARS
jgi:hypothetical protein